VNDEIETITYDIIQIRNDSAILGDHPNQIDSRLFHCFISHQISVINHQSFAISQSQHDYGSKSKVPKPRKTIVIHQKVATSQKTASLNRKIRTRASPQFSPLVNFFNAARADR
jgi:hypothetical protein